MIHLLAYLVVAHFVCDFVLQGDTMAREKSPRSSTALQKNVPWGYWMLAHSLTHGAAVTLLTQQLYLGVAEAAAHFVIDYVKCEGRINIHADQAIHVSCKVLWAVLAWA